MSFSKNEIIDPSREVQNVRVEWSLDLKDSIYLNDSLKIINLGLVTSAGVASYNVLTGVKSLIKHARLMNGREVISSLRHANRYLGWLEYNRTNSKNMSLKQWEARSKNGVKLESDGANYVMNYTQVNASNQTNTTRETTNTGCIYLSELFPILNNEDFILHSSIFKNLRVEIEYDMRPEVILTQTNLGGTINTTTPQLVVDVVVDQQDYAEMTKNALSMNLQFKELEHDQFVMPHSDAAVGSTVAQKQVVDAKLNAFDNKVVDRLLISKEYANLNRYSTGGNVYGVGPLGSVANYRENWQFVVNHAEILPDGGWDKDSVIQSNLVDVWGESSNWGGSFNFDWTNKADDWADSNTVGQGSWVGVKVSDLVKNMNIRFTRFNLDDRAVAPIAKKANEKEIVHVYGETLRQLLVVNGSYTISNVSN
tara:strand:- start:1988 stop:3259 length:1272 start_codon:yes stop_codon:yes gene_type:complete